MKEENKRKNMEEELFHPDESFKAARILINSKLFREAVPKLYYAVFHSLRALLFTEGLEPKSHEGVSHYFTDCNEWYERVGEFIREVRKYLKDY